MSDELTREQVRENVNRALYGGWKEVTESLDRILDHDAAQRAKIERLAAQLEDALRAINNIKTE